MRDEALSSDWCSKSHTLNGIMQDRVTSVLVIDRYGVYETAQMLIAIPALPACLTGLWAIGYNYGGEILKVIALESTRRKQDSTLDTTVLFVVLEHPKIMGVNFFNLWIAKILIFLLLIVIPNKIYI